MCHTIYPGVLIQEVYLQNICLFIFKETNLACKFVLSCYDVEI